MKTRPSSQDFFSQRLAFTLLELVVIVGLLALGAMLLSPALARTRPPSNAFQCLENSRRLAVAISMYSADNTDFYPPNPDDGTTTPGYTWSGTGRAGVGEVNEFNPDSLTNAARCLLSPYLGQNSGVFRCPADQRSGLYSGVVPSLIGKIVPATRSVSMNSAVGTIDPAFAAGSGHSGKPNQPTKGPWLTGSHGANNPALDYATFGKRTDFQNVLPSRVFLLTDEEPYSLNDGVLATTAVGRTFIDFPATWHERGCGISFCDGRAEIHRWNGTAINYGPLYSSGAHAAISASDISDWTWLANASTQHR